MIFFYILLLAGAVVSYIVINNYGNSIFTTNAVEPVVVNAESSNQFSNLLHVLLALAVVIATARIMGRIFSIINQPTVIGEVIGGILIGPSLLGKYAPEVYAYILPNSVAPIMGIIAQLGVILYMFLVGLELDLRVLKTSGHKTLAISHASIVAPFILGSLLALKFYNDYAPDGISFTVFSLFFGVSMSITAFPVLARIITDKKIQKTELGAITLTCAAIDDVTAWCLLAFIVSSAQVTMMNAVYTLLMTVAYIAFMFVFVRPIVTKAVLKLDQHKIMAEGELAIICFGIFVSALATEYIGIHAIFGAFLFGAIIPEKSKLAHDLDFRLQDLVRVLFLPCFFAFTGMRTEIGLVSTPYDWMMCLVIIAVATLGKFGGSMIAAKFYGVGWRDSAAIGILMNTRGLVELIVLNIGLDLGIISPRLFAMLVIMALATTFMTGPLLELVLKGSNLEPAGEDETRGAAVVSTPSV